MLTFSNVMLCCIWVLCSLLVDNSDSPSIVEQSQQGHSSLVAILY